MSYTRINETSEMIFRAEIDSSSLANFTHGKKSGRNSCLTQVSTSNHPRHASIHSSVSFQNRTVRESETLGHRALCKQQKETRQTIWHGDVCATRRIATDAPKIYGLNKAFPNFHPIQFTSTAVFEKHAISIRGVIGITRIRSRNLE